MDWRVLAAALLLAVPSITLSGSPFTALHPEEAYPDPAVPGGFDPYAEFVSDVQRKLRALGFDAGPVNGDFGSKTQAALAQFQISAGIPASGQLDDATLAGLGVQRKIDDSSDAAAGSSSEPSLN